MNIDVVSSVVNEAVKVVILTSLPSVGIGLLVGLIVAIVQAVTQVQEQTLTFVPKMIVVFLILAATFPWMTRVLMEMAIHFWSNIPAYSK